MPTTYAHWRFGDECISTMPENLKNIVNKYRDLYNIGVHGPDFFFYELKDSSVAKYGSKMHYVASMDFFASTKDAIKNNPDKYEPMMAYVLGFLSHFTFDTTAHGYVERKKEVSNVTHNKIEAEYDRHVMEMEGLTPHKVDRAATLHPTKFNASIIALFFPFDTDVIHRAIKSQRICLKGLNAPSKAKHKFLVNTLTKLKKFDYIDLIIDAEEYTPCKDADIRIDKLRNKALGAYPALLDSLINYYENDVPLIDFFNHTFCEWPDYKDIPVLDYESELNYIVEPYLF